MQAGLAFKGQGVFHNAEHGYGSVQRLDGDSARVLFRSLYSDNTKIITVSLKEIETAAVLPEHRNPILRLEYSTAKECWIAVRGQAEEVFQ